MGGFGRSPKIFVMRTNLQIFDDLVHFTQLPFVEMDMVEFIGSTGFEIHPLFRKLYNPHVFTSSFELAQSSDVMSLRAITTDNLEASTLFLGVEAITLAAAASGSLYFILKDLPNQVSEYDLDEKGEPKCYRSLSAEEFVDLYNPFPLKTLTGEQDAPCKNDSRVSDS